MKSVGSTRMIRKTSLALGPEESSQKPIGDVR